MGEHPWMRRDGARLLLDVQVTPRASRSRVVGRHGDRLKVQVAAPPAEGAANAELVRFLAATLGVARRDVAVVRGAASRAKTVAVDGVDAARAAEALGAAAGAPAP